MTKCQCDWGAVGVSVILKYFHNFVYASFKFTLVGLNIKVKAQWHKINRLPGRFVEQKLMLRFSLRFHQIHKCQKYDFDCTLLCYLSHTYMFNKLTSEASLFNKCSWAPTLGCHQSNKCQRYDFGISLLCLLSQTSMFLGGHFVQL